MVEKPLTAKDRMTGVSGEYEPMMPPVAGSRISGSSSTSTATQVLTEEFLRTSTSTPPYILLIFPVSCICSLHKPLCQMREGYSSYERKSAVF